MARTRRSRMQHTTTHGTLRRLTSYTLAQVLSSNSVVRPVRSSSRRVRASSSGNSPITTDVQTVELTPTAHKRRSDGMYTDHMEQSAAIKSYKSLQALRIS